MLEPPASDPRPGPAPVPPVARWRWWVHLAVIGSYPVLAVLLGQWSRGQRTGAALPPTVAGLLQVCGLEIAIFSLIFAVGWLASRATREDLRLSWRPGFWVLPLGLGYSVAIRLAVAFLVVAVSVVLVVTEIATAKGVQDFMTNNRPQVETIIDPAALRNNPAYYWLSLTLVSFVVAGLREELWRSAVLAGLARGWPSFFGSRPGQMAGVFLAAVVFGAAHAPQGVIGATVAGVLGLLLGLIMVWHRSIWPAVLAHGFFDATSFAVLPWAMERLKPLA